MTDIELKIKKWIQLIQTEKLEGLIEDIKDVVTKNLRGKLNKHIFKLLLYLSHTADRCNKQNLAIGKQIYKLTCLLCSILVEIPDGVKYVACLYHIIRCLLTMYLYKEASEICVYLKTDFYSQDVSDILVKTAHLWHGVVNNTFPALQKEPLIYEHYSNLKTIIRYEFEVIQMVHKSFTKLLLMKISSYLDKILSVTKEPNTYFNDFYTFVIEYLNGTNLVLNVDEKYIITRQILHISSKVICRNINEKCLKSATETLHTISNHFKPVLLEDDECYQCFLLFESVCLVLLKPIKYLNECTPKSIQNLNDNYLKIIECYGYTGAIKWSTLTIVEILEHLFIYWETCIKSEKQMFLKNDILLRIMELVACVSACFRKRTSGQCKSCLDKDCMIRRDTYNAVVIKIKCINFINKLPASCLSKDICRLLHKFLENSVADVYEMKKCKCKCWSLLWSTCSALIYNLGIILSESFYEESVSLLSLLFTSIMQFEGIQTKSQYINLENPICFTLHRLSSVHYNHGMCREAMTVTALNALLSYDDIDSKAFRMWANIKHKMISSKEIEEMTILACLRKDKTIIGELGLFIDLSKYDLMEICLRETAGLQEAKVNLSNSIRQVLKEMITLNATPIQYARAVQMLVHHSLNFSFNEDITEYIKQANSNLKNVKTSNSVLCLQGNFEFYTFIMQLYDMNKQTQIEMESTKFALQAPKISEIGENESRDVVPAYTMINMKEDSRLWMYIQKPLKKWNKCFRKSISEIAISYDPLITLKTLIIAGEYARLHRYEECEINIWKLVYALAVELQNNYAIIYVIGRSISARYINNEWINTGKELANRLKDSKDEDIAYAIAIFWTSLSDFYFECNMLDEARKLLDESRKIPGVSFFRNQAVYLYGLDRILYNYYLYKETIKHEEYTRYIVETLYTMVNLSEGFSPEQWKPQDRRLFGYDVLLSATVNLSLRMNSLLSFREIGTHLIRRLKTAQSLGAIIRIAEILKCLCYIDLSRSQLNDCEVKLQGLEHILNMDKFKASMDSKPTKLAMDNVLITPAKGVDPLRDASQNHASPILRNKVFDLPEFMSHKHCNCYICTNVSYHYLVFSCTHIRAQLYALQNNKIGSLQHFHGAFKIKENLMKVEKTSKNQGNYVSWQERFYSIDYVLLLTNFAYFLRTYLYSKREKIVDIISLAIRMCDVHKLKGHPIYMAVKELMLDYHFESIFNNVGCSTFTVPDPSDIDISKYVQESTNERDICITPISNVTRIKKPITLRRNRTPPLLHLTKVSMNFSDDEDNSYSPTPPTRYRKMRSHSKLIKRKILDEEYSDGTDKTKQLQNSLSVEEITNSIGNVSMKDVVEKITSIVPDISEYLTKVVDKMDEPATDKNIKELINKIEDLKVNVNSQNSMRKTRHSKQLTSSDYNKINEAIALFKNLAINENENNDLSNKTAATSKHNDESVPTIIIDDSPCQSRTTEESSIEKLEQDSLSLNQSNHLKRTPKTNRATLRVTRSSVKNSIVNKELDIRSRRSKQKLLK